MFPSVGELTAWTRASISSEEPGFQGAGCSGAGLLLPQHPWAAASLPLAETVSPVLGLPDLGVPRRTSER